MAKIKEKIQGIRQLSIMNHSDTLSSTRFLKLQHCQITCRAKTYRKTISDITNLYFRNFSRKYICTRLISNSQGLVGAFEQRLIFRRFWCMVNQGKNQDLKVKFTKIKDLTQQIYENSISFSFAQQLFRIFYICNRSTTFYKDSSIFFLVLSLIRL